MANLGPTSVHIFYLLNLLVLVKACHGGLVASLTCDTEYGDIAVKLMRHHQAKWLRHEPKAEEEVIEYLFVKTTQDEQYLSISQPYIDIIIIGNVYYFKSKNELWNSQRPFEGNKYIYYKWFNSKLYAIDGIAYINALKECYSDRSTLELWNRASVNYVRFLQPESNNFGDIDAFPERVVCRSKTIWHFYEQDAIVFLRFQCLIHNRRNVFKLYFKDLNDNVISTLHLISPRYPYYIYPWRGLPQKTYIPRSIPTFDRLYRARLLVLLKIMLKHDGLSTPLVLYSEVKTTDRVSKVFLAHPIAGFNLIVYAENKLYFKEYIPFILMYQQELSKSLIYALSYEAGNTVMHMIDYNGAIKNDSIVENPAIKVFSFELHLNDERDERMYSITYFYFGINRATVYTANRHLAFNKVYGFGGIMVVNDVEFGSPIDQFVVCGDLYHVVIRGVDGVNFIRYFKEAESPTWSRATDAYPELLPVISEPS